MGTRQRPRGPLAAGPLRALSLRLAEPVDAAGLAAFRVVFGGLLLVAVARYAAKGMIHEAFVEPRMFFPLVPGLGPFPAPGMHIVFAALALAAACIVIGWRTRAAAALFALLFTYAHFADLTHYLNHYYLVSLLTGLMVVLPVAAVWSFDSRRSGDSRAATVPVWTLWLLRFQVACVYWFAGLAKLRSDWLGEGLPLGIWLAGCGDVPLVGPLLVRPEAGLVMSWLGAAFDLTIPFLLLWRRSRVFAYAGVVVFHLLTARLFRLGMFPLFMMAASLLFLEPDWPRRLLRRPREQPGALRTAPVGHATLIALAAYALFQVGFPLRHHLYGDDVLWTERGYRFAWNVMLIEKNGVAEFSVRRRDTGEEQAVRLRDHLTPLQIKMMATQPDFIRAFAQALATEERRNGRAVAVYANVLVSLNGRPARHLIDPTADLAAERLPAGWIVPLGSPASSQPSVFLQLRQRP